MHARAWIQVIHIVTDTITLQECGMAGQMDKPPQITNKAGFTIVELLMVIVVIAILAAITIVAYNGIQTRAKDSAIVSDLQSLAK